MKFVGVLGNIFKGPTGNWDLGRIVGFKAGFAYPFVYIYGVVAKGAIPEPSAFGLGYAAVLGGIGLLIGAKDIAVSKANATAAASAP